jgi:hypothetical protein
MKAKIERTVSPEYSHRQTEYRGFGIVPKNDFGQSGYLVHGHMVTEGYIVTENGCNALPGAMWVLTVQQAKDAIDDLLKAREDGNSGSEHPFHKRNRLRRSLNSRSLELFEAVIHHLEETYDATGGPSPELAKVLLGIIDDCDTRTTITRRIGEYDPQMIDIFAQYGLTGYPSLGEGLRFLKIDNNGDGE